MFSKLVLYADIVNFTLISSYHSATEVVNLLNYLFCLIDKLTDKYEAFKVSFKCKSLLQVWQKLQSPYNSAQVFTATGDCSVC